MVSEFISNKKSVFSNSTPNIEDIDIPSPHPLPPRQYIPINELLKYGLEIAITYSNNVT